MVDRFGGRPLDQETGITTDRFGGIEVQNEFTDGGGTGDSSAGDDRVSQEPVGAVEAGVGALESGAGLGSRMVALPAATIAALVQSINPLALEGAGQQAFTDVREALTFDPRTPSGQQQLEATLGTGRAGLTLATSFAVPAVAGLSGAAAALTPGLAPGVGARVSERVQQALTPESSEQLQAVGNLFAPIARALEASEEFLGDKTFEATGSPVLATAAKLIPTAILEATGLVGLKTGIKATTGIRSRAAIKEAGEAAPTTSELFEISGAVFDEIDDLGGVVRPEAFARLTEQVEIAAREVGGSPLTTKPTFGVIQEFKNAIDEGVPITLEKLDQLRTVATRAAKTLDPSQQSPTLAIIDTVDDFLDRGSDFIDLPRGSPNIGERYRVARNLWGRGRRAELIENAIEKAKNAEGSFEKALRGQFRTIINSPRQRKWFPARELKELTQVVRGNKKLRDVAKIGFLTGSNKSIITALLGVGVTGGPIGAALPLVGDIAGFVADRGTRRGATLVDRLIRSGGLPPALQAPALTQNQIAAALGVGTLPGQIEGEQ